MSVEEDMMIRNREITGKVGIILFSRVWPES